MSEITTANEVSNVGKIAKPVPLECIEFEWKGKKCYYSYYPASWLVMNYQNACEIFRLRYLERKYLTDNEIWILMYAYEIGIKDGEYAGRQGIKIELHNLLRI